MNRRLNIVRSLAVVTVLTTLAASAAWANKALPPQPKPEQQHQAYTIEISPLAKGQNASRLVIPKAMVRQLQAGAVETRKAEAAPGPSRTVVAGLALSMALCFGGFWFLRRRQGIGGHSSTGLLLVAALIPAGLWAGSAALANVAKPYPRPPVPPPTPATRVQVEVGKGKVIELRLSETDSHG